MVLGAGRSSGGDRLPEGIAFHVKHKSKLTRSHATTTPEGLTLRRWAESIPAVMKVGAGIIKPAGSSRAPLSYKLRNEQGCICVVVRGKLSIQETRLYGNAGGIECALREHAKDKGIIIRT